MLGSDSRDGHSILPLHGPGHAKCCRFMESPVRLPVSTVATREFGMSVDAAPVLAGVSDVVSAAPRNTNTVIGASAPWCAVLKLASQVAATETTVCLQGASGTGKEMVARFIHATSRRRLGAFVGINCAALPDGLFESELFGYERGAFTGAQGTKPGQVELARGGVLFLDEVTEIPLPAQAKLLRVLQEREFFRLGGIRPIRINVRVIAATNQDLASAVSGGRFREDLYYRINVFDIRLPPLRQRGGDVLLLAKSFLDRYARTNGGARLQVTKRAEDALLAYHWPGNVRELGNVLERAAIVCDGPFIDAEHLSFASRAEAPSFDSTHLHTLERQAILQALREVDGNTVRAAERLGISRHQLY